MPKKEMLVRDDYKHATTVYMTDETKKDYDWMGKLFKGSYPRLKWNLINIALRLLAKAIKKHKIKPGDDIEAALGL